jgi:hypothetical protein
MARALIHGLPNDGVGCQGKGGNERPYPHHMTLTLNLLGVLSLAVAVLGGLVTYDGQMKEDPSGEGLFTLPTHQRRNWAITILGVLITVVSLILALSQ